MNRILFSADEVLADGTVTLADFRAVHIRTVLNANVGDTLRTGIVNGPVGTSRIERMTDDSISLQTSHEEIAPEPWIDLILAAPRPKVLKRLWPQLAALGVGRIIVLNAFRVEKTYFHSQWTTPEYYMPLLFEGLAQAGTSRLPEVHIKTRFKPFVEDELDAMFPGALRLLAHPGEGRGGIPSEMREGSRPLLAVGPEGGWIDYELNMLAGKGFIPFSLGPRTLRTDTATIGLIAALMMLHTER